MPKYPSKVKAINIKLKIIILWIWKGNFSILKGHFCVVCQKVEGPWSLWPPSSYVPDHSCPLTIKFLLTWLNEKQAWKVHILSLKISHPEIILIPIMPVQTTIDFSKRLSFGCCNLAVPQYGCKTFFKIIIVIFAIRGRFRGAEGAAALPFVE